MPSQSEYSAWSDSGVGSGGVDRMARTARTRVCRAAVAKSADDDEEEDAMAEVDATP
jgi:hypothetical protein